MDTKSIKKKKRPKKQRMAKNTCRNPIKNRKNKKIYTLKENGKDIKQKKIQKNPVFILGDHKGLPKQILKYLKTKNTEKISLGPKSYFTTQSITLIHNQLDRTQR